MRKEARLKVSDLNAYFQETRKRRTRENKSLKVNEIYNSESQQLNGPFFEV